MAACRGVIHDWNEKWIVGFSRFIGFYSALKAELWSGKRRVTLELDNIEVVNMLNSSAKVEEHNLSQKLVHT
ncbi:hypothetical protein GOBAR_DD32224 [Gossypium barbadense]|nr:hypothetical protein GOBAR_DD32224 [Gossypium barbadense]